MKKLEKIKNLSEQAFDLIRDAILNNVLKAGKLYSATEIGEWIGASRTPIREAAQQLAAIGLVRIEKNRGIRILPTSLEQLIEAFQIRLMIEVPLVRNVAQNTNPQDMALIEKAYETFRLAAESNDARKTLEADKEYHLALLRAAHLERALAIIENTRNTVLLTGSSTIPHARSCMEAFNDHTALHEAIINNNPDQAAIEMERHIINTAKLLITQEAATRDDWDATNLYEHFSWIHNC